MHDWLAAVHMLEAMHAAYPPEAKQCVKGFLPFATIAGDASSLIRTNERAEAYCIKWLPILESAMALYRSKNQEDYARI